MSAPGARHAPAEPAEPAHKPRRRPPRSDSDCSAETASQSADSGERRPPPARAAKGRGRRRGSEWEVLEGLKDGQRFEKRPEVFNGYLHKKRKWPLKGWHKRFFVVDGGILVYARSPSDVARGRLHGSLDVGLSVISAKPRRRRVDIDADEFIYHLRAKTPDVFRTWLLVLKAHRLYRQHLLTFGARESVPKIHAPLDDMPPTDSSRLLSPAGALRGPQAGFVSGTPGGLLGSWIVESGAPLEACSKELSQAQQSVQQLQRLLEALELQQQAHHDTDVSVEGASPNVKSRRKFGLRKKKSGSKCSVELPAHLDVSASHMAISALTAPPSPGASSSAPTSAASLPIACAAARPQSLPGPESLGGPAPPSLCSLTPDHQAREDFTVLAKDLVSSLKTVVGTLVRERGRLRSAMESPEPRGGVAALRTTLCSALQQNSDLRARLSRIHDASDLADGSDAPDPFPRLSYSSSCVSGEFYDAEEHDPDTERAGVIELDGDGDSSSDAGSAASVASAASLSSEDASAASDNSDAAALAAAPSQRARLPCPRPTPGGPSLWNLLYKNIGKDLSQISMPVTINEPLNILQRLCEELEYSRLLDAAAACGDPVRRLCLVAAFAVSAYAGSQHRAASKPFNPLLHETYEHAGHAHFVAEQVSHHPPVSACHAAGARWRCWQEARVRTRFWGKSMEFQPTGLVHLELDNGEQYSWNKVTTCVHNLFGGQRWVDQYGDMQVECRGSPLRATLTFVKASSWSVARHSVTGDVWRGAARAARLAGRWTEGLYAGQECLWHTDPMPPDYQLYYGFTRFAMGLNELQPGLRELLPHTDTRLRPDQRALEEGNVSEAERLKHELEEAQRGRRQETPPPPRWFRKATVDGEETWVYGGEYWAARERGFPDLDVPRLW